jgi:hypothetical protein
MFKKFFEPLLDADDGLSVANGADSPTADGEETPDNETNSDELSEEMQDEPQDELQDEPVEEHDDITMTKAFSDRLNKAREKDLQRIADLEAIAEEKRTLETQYGRLQGVLGELGYEGSAEQIADEIEAQNRQITPEQVRAEREAEEKRFQQALENHPVIQNAKKIQEQQDINMMNMQIEKDIREIQQLNPEIKSIEDLGKLPNVDMIIALVKNGATYGQAYKRIHEMTHSTTKKTVDTKTHLQGIGGSGSGSSELVDIPADELSTWKSAFPDISPKELKQKYNNALNR